MNCQSWEHLNWVEKSTVVHLIPVKYDYLFRKVKYLSKSKLSYLVNSSNCYMRVLTKVFIHSSVLKLLMGISHTYILFLMIRRYCFKFLQEKRWSIDPLKPQNRFITGSTSTLENDCWFEIFFIQFVNLDCCYQLCSLFRSWYDRTI